MALNYAPWSELAETKTGVLPSPPLMSGDTNTVNNVVMFADKDFLLKMVDKDWPVPVDFVFALVVGTTVVTVLGCCVEYWVESLHVKGKTKTPEERSALEDMELSPTIARYEQFLFYLAAVAGAQVFGFAIGGWLVFKGISRYARWNLSEKRDIPAPRADSVRLEHSEFLRLQRWISFRTDARNHNRFQIFLIGTLLSVAAGGIAGVVYHYILYLFDSYPGGCIGVFQHAIELVMENLFANASQ